MATSSENVELGVRQDDPESESPCCSQLNDDVFVQDETPPPSAKTENGSARHSDYEHTSRSRERRHSRRSNHRSRSHNPGYNGSAVTKTELIRASAERAERERHRNQSSHSDGRSKHRQKEKLAPRISSQRRRSYSANRRPSDEYLDYRLASPRTYRRRNGSMSPHRTSPRQSLSASPKHQPHLTGSSKTSLLSKPSASVNNSPLRGTGVYTDQLLQGGATTALLPRAHSSGSNSYSKPAMEVAVAALVFGAGVVTLIVALIIGSNAWMIVGAISMAIGGVFIAFGAYFYISRYKPLQATREHMEIRVIDNKHLAELSRDGFRRRIDMDL